MKFKVPTGPLTAKYFATTDDFQEWLTVKPGLSILFSFKKLCGTEVVKIVRCEMDGNKVKFLDDDDQVVDMDILDKQATGQFYA